MHYPIIVQGRELLHHDILWLNDLINEHPDWGRSRLSRRIAEHWQWSNDAGVLKDIAARTLLRKLDSRGLIRLPPRQSSPPHSKRAKREIQPVLHCTDRIEEALGFFAGVQPGDLASKLQYDACSAYLALYTEKLRPARSLASRYREFPVARWRQFFAGVATQIDEIDGGTPARVVDEKDAAQEKTKLAATEPGFEFDVESRQVTLRYQNLESCRVNFYRMDIELLFSRNPFVQQYSGRFAFIRPNRTLELELDREETTRVFDIPERFHTSNVLVEIVGGGVRKSRTYFANALALQLVENYAQLRVSHESSGKALARVYVKVYANMKDGRVRFYKDGYTDLRGRFDYGSLSTSELDGVRGFSILVLSDDHGAVVREARPPQM